MAAAVVSYQYKAFGATFAAGAGSNRLLVLTVSSYAWSTQSISAWSITDGSTTASVANGKLILAKAHAYEYAADSFYYSAIFYVKEADIPAGTITLGTPSWGATSREDSAGAGIYTLSGVDQTTPEDAESSVYGDTTDPLSSTLGVASGSVQIMHATNNASGATMAPYGTGWSEDYEAAGTSNGNSTNYHLDAQKTTATGATIDWGIDFGAVCRCCAVVVSFAQVATVKYLKLLTHSAAASATSVEGWVVTDDNATYIGYFSGQAFEASLESGEAVLKVATTDIDPDGALLTTSDTPLVVVRNTASGTTMCDATVIEE